MMSAAVCILQTHRASPVCAPSARIFSTATRGVLIPSWTVVVRFVIGMAQYLRFARRSKKKIRSQAAGKNRRYSGLKICTVPALRPNPFHTAVVGFKMSDESDGSFNGLRKDLKKIYHEGHSAFRRAYPR